MFVIIKTKRKAWFYFWKEVNMIKIIVSDLDGTLLNSNKQISERTEKELVQLKEAGYILGVATGRPLFSVLASVPNAKTLFDFAICNNGGDIHDFKDNTTHHNLPLSGETVLEIVETYRPLGANPILYLNSQMVTERPDDYNYSIRNMLDIVFVGDIMPKIEQEHAKVIFSATPEVVEKMQAYYAAHPSKDYKMFKSQAQLVEFTNPHINKELGLEYYCEKYGYELSHVLSFGDNDNDFEMVKAAGVGVAVENATDKVKAVADHITLTNDEEGVYQFLQSYFARD